MSSKDKKRFSNIIENLKISEHFEFVTSFLIKMHLYLCF